MRCRSPRTRPACTWCCTCRTAFDDVLLCDQAAAEGVVVRPLSRHYLQRQGTRQGLLLGYAGVGQRQIRPAFDKLAKLIEKMM